MFLRNPYNGAFGLDIGDLSIKLIQLDLRTTLSGNQYYQLKETRSISLMPGYIINGTIEQPEMVRRKLLQLLGKEKSGFSYIKNPWVVADLPEPRTFLKTIEVEANPKELTNDDILYQARKHLPFVLDEAYIDWQITNPETTDGVSKIIIGAVPKVIADSYTYLLESVDLKPIALEVEAAAIARAMITAGKDYGNEARALLDIGATRSSLIIYDHSTLQYSSNLTFSSESITNALVKEMNIDHNQAEKIKIQTGLGYTRDNNMYLKTITDLTDELVRQIQQAITFYYEHFLHHNPITHITMTGGGSLLKNLDFTLTRLLKITAQPGNAWKNLENTKQTLDQNLGSSYSSAIGLALRAAQKPW